MRPLVKELNHCLEKKSLCHRNEQNKSCMSALLIFGNPHQWPAHNNRPHIISMKTHKHKWSRHFHMETFLLEQWHRGHVFDSQSVHELILKMSCKLLWIILSCKLYSTDQMFGVWKISLVLTKSYNLFLS